MTRAWNWDLWVAFGFAGQLLFTLRFLVQWITSEKSGRSVIPVYFWYFSLGGGLILSVYAWHKRDPVFFLGQSVGLIVYVRNLMLIRTEGRKLKAEVKNKE
ncbi:MAG TPA: lipid-A-disaccharide synthase N-terminal domain-containing protein [Thermoanaerobaculia bacterium]|nr:lipid-A-disaccharide synthase N-terminal domain-containing protein [Thermoanaerobaculia bacterium]